MWTDFVRFFQNARRATADSTDWNEWSIANIWNSKKKIFYFKLRECLYSFIKRFLLKMYLFLKNWVWRYIYIFSTSLALHNFKFRLLGPFHILRDFLGYRWLRSVNNLGNLHRTDDAHQSIHFTVDLRTKEEIFYLIACYNSSA